MNVTKKTWHKRKESDKDFNISSGASTSYVSETDIQAADGQMLHELIVK